jgi:hypothetical protein
MTFESLVKGYFLGYFLTILLFLWLVVRGSKSKKREVQNKMAELRDAGPFFAAFGLVAFCSIWPYHLYKMLTSKKAKK